MKLGKIRTRGGRQGFTLVEMLVVIGMIAIVTAVAFPKIKGIYEEFRINQTVEEAATLVSSYRSYYLIMNEFPTDESPGYTRGGWYFPRNFYTASSRKFTVKPYKGSCFDFDEWATQSDVRVEYRRKQDAILLNIKDLSDAVVKKYKIKFSNLYPQNPLPMDGEAKRFGIMFPEIPKEFCESEPVAHRNRYH